MSDTAAASSSSTPEKPRGSKRGRSHKTKASGPPKEEEEETVDVEPPKRKEEEEEDEPEAKRPAPDTSSSPPPPPPPSPKAEAVPVAAPPAAAAVAPGKEEEVAKPVAVAKKAGKKPEAVDKTISSVERDFRRLFARDAGYRFWASDLNLKHVTVRLSKVSDKKMAEYRAKAGRALKNMKDRYVNVNSLFSTIPSDEEILSKFVPDLVEKARTEPFRVIQLSPPCKAKWVRLQGLGNFDKPKFAPENEKDAGHELSLTAGAYDEARVDSDGCDPSAFAWMQHLDKMWQQIAHEIASNKEIAPDLHKKCAEDMERLVAERPLAAGEKYEERYLAHFKNTYIKKRDLEQKFVYKMFRYPTAEEQEMFRSEPYKAPSDRLQQVYDDAGPKDKIVYNDFPVVRPKTKEEAEASFATDPNPFVAVPFEQRGEIRDNSICSVLYEVGVTESAKDKSHLKLRPLLLIWIRDVARKPAVKKEKKPFVFSSVEVSEDMIEDCPLLVAIPRHAPITIEELRAMFPDKKVDEEVKALLDEGFIFASIDENTYQRT